MCYCEHVFRCRGFVSTLTLDGNRDAHVWRPAGGDRLSLTRKQQVLRPHAQTVYSACI